MKKSEFYTLKGYQMQEENQITNAMEDYLEMLYRLNNKEIHLKDLAEKLNVKPPSASKMMNRLKDLGLVSYQKYKTISLTKLGKQVGFYFYERHQTLVQFFKQLNGKDYTLKQVELIEHFIDYETIQNMKKWIEK